MEARFGVPAPARDRKGVRDGLRQAAVVRFVHRARRGSGMEIEGNIQFFSGCQQRLETCVIEELSVNGSIDHGADQPELCDAPLKLGRRAVRILERERSESRVTLRMTPYGLGEHVIRAARTLFRGSGVGSGALPHRGKGETLQVD